MRRVFFIFFIAITVGVAAGLSYAWLLAPSRPRDRTPEHLNAVDRELYLRLIADSYAATGDRAAAEARLAAMGHSSPDYLKDLIAADLQPGHSALDNSHLAALALALEIASPAAGLLAPSRPLPPATSLPPQSSDLVTTPEPATQTRFILTNHEVICTPGMPVRRMEILVLASDGQPVPGATITVRWEGGLDRLVTGFHAGRSPGYADFEMEPGITYAVSIAGDEAQVIDGQVEFCADGQDGGWRFEYRAQTP